MEQSAREAYLTTQVMTATPQKLHLMLIEGAIRAALQAKHHFQSEDREQAGEALIVCQEIVSELLASVSSGQHDLSKKIGGIYIFLLRHLTEAHLKHEANRIDDVVRVLEEERTTWRQVCEQYGSTIEPATEPVLEPAPAALEHAAAQHMPSGSTTAPNLSQSSEASAPAGFDSSSVGDQSGAPIIPPLPAEMDLPSEGGISFEA